MGVGCVNEMKRGSEKVLSFCVYTRKIGYEEIFDYMIDETIICRFLTMIGVSITRRMGILRISSSFLIEMRNCR